MRKKTLEIDLSAEFITTIRRDDDATNIGTNIGTNDATNDAKIEGLSVRK